MNYRFHLLPADQFRPDVPVHSENVIPALNDFFKNFFEKSHSTFTQSGREAMTLLFNHLALKRSDEVFITTTFDFPNVSSCVTSTVFNHCKPSRVLTNDTKAIFIIHEFGVIHPELERLRATASQRDIPLIEDCAHTFLSWGKGNEKAGKLGDWVILSFPKFFPVRSGGMLLGNRNFESSIKQDDNLLADAEIIFISLRDISLFSLKRIELSNQFMRGISKNVRPLLSENDSLSIPWFFPVEVSDPKFFLNRLNHSGVETGLWHGSNVIVLPLHQYFSGRDVTEMISVFNAIQNEIQP